MQISRKGDLITDESFENEEGVVLANFGGVSCEFEQAGKSRKNYKFILDVQVKNGVYQDNRGFCTPAEIPTYNANDKVMIQYDEDDDGIVDSDIATISIN